MGRGLGWVQWACLKVIKDYEQADDWPTTFNIAAYVYQVKPDKNGDRWISNAQHVAVKCALEGLQRKGRIIGFRAQRARVPFGQPDSDGRTELCHHWMTAARLKEWLKDQEKFAARAHTREGVTYFLARVERIRTKAKAIGMEF